MNLYEIIFHSATESLIVSDSNGEIKDINAATEELFGYSRDELVGNTVEVLIPKEFRDNHHKHRENYVKQPKKRQMGKGITLYGLKKNGTTIPLEISLNYIKHNDEVLILTMITDVSERKKIEEEIKNLNQELEQRVADRTKKLEETQKLYYLIAQNFPGGTINVFDKNLNYIFVEGEELIKLGIDSKKLIDSNYINRLPKDIRIDVKEKLQPAFDGKSISFEIKALNNYYKINAVPIAFENGNVSQILVVEKNITREKLAEIKVLEALEREKQLNELKSRFVSMASHEFRTPLSTILSSASLIEKYLEKNDAEKTTKHINRVKSSVGLLTSILNDFLSLSKLEEGKIQLNKSSFNVKELFMDILDDLKNTQNKPINLHYFHQNNEVIISDKSFLKNIAYNLLSNAFKYSTSEVICETKIANGRLHIHVEDDGIGIPNEEQKNLFTRFYRAKNVINIQGTGLGLNIVKHYLGLLNGEISFKSIEGKTIFEVSIPIEL
ncbi:MAG: PAS domain S-box protein [Bacteroidia bacterium]